MNSFFTDRKPLPYFTPAKSFGAEISDLWCRYSRPREAAEDSWTTTIQFWLSKKMGMNQSFYAKTGLEITK